MVVQYWYLIVVIVIPLVVIVAGKDGTIELAVINEIGSTI